jgi:hypothetical protein
MYVVLGGSGTVESSTLMAFRALSFNDTMLAVCPGTIHRLIVHGDLEILVIMQNGGLPERSDNVCVC